MNMRLDSVRPTSRTCTPPPDGGAHHSVRGSQATQGADGHGAAAGARRGPEPRVRGEPRAPTRTGGPRGENDHGRRDHAPVAGERGALRAPDASLEPEDEALHLHR